MMNKMQKRMFEHDMRALWAATKAAIRPEYHADLRKIMLRVIKAEEREYKEFVKLMEADKKTNAEPDVNKQLQEAAYDRADELQDIETGVVTHQCHYCGDMYHVSDLSTAKEGLICYKCRMEMENQE